MGQVTINARGKKLQTIEREVLAHADEGRDVVLVIGEDASPERVVKVIQAVVGDYDVNIVVRHAELQEYVDNALRGAAIGAGLAGGGILAAIALGNPVGLGAALTALAVGALAGAAAGAGVTPLAQVTVYRVRGETRIKFAAA